jgi:hypothetical protein
MNGKNGHATIRIFGKEISYKFTVYGKQITFMPII